MRKITNKPCSTLWFNSLLKGKATPKTRNPIPTFENPVHHYYNAFVFEVTVYVSAWIITRQFSVSSVCHSSQFHGLCSTKCSSETLQNLPYFIYIYLQKPKVAFSVFHFMQLYFWLNRKSNFGVL